MLELGPRQDKTTTIRPSLTQGSPGACRFSARAGWAGVMLTQTRCSISHAHPPTHLAPLHRNEEMAAPALAIQVALEMAAALIHKKEWLPTLTTAPNLLLLLTPSMSHISIPTHPQPKNFSCTIWAPKIYCQASCGKKWLLKVTNIASIEPKIIKGRNNPINLRLTIIKTIL